MLENFVAMALMKQSAWRRIQPRVFPRTQTGPEVDLVLEDAAGRVIVIEVKATVIERCLRHILDAGRSSYPRTRRRHPRP